MLNVLEDLLAALRQTAAELPDSRQGRNTRYAVADAVGCAFSVFFVQSPSFLNFQRLMQQESSRSNCQTLLGRVARGSLTLGRSQNRA